MVDTTISPYGRGACSKCGREMNLRKNGTVRHHAGERVGPYREYRCAGSGELPAPHRPGEVE